LLLSNGLNPSGAIRGANKKKAPANAWKNNHIFADHNLDSGATKAQVEEGMKGHILAEGQLMGKYSR
jgi:phosphatidylethanolamine-binding protein (PEBP) family uncharacterized protein